MPRHALRSLLTFPLPFALALALIVSYARWAPDPDRDFASPPLHILDAR